MAELNKSTGLFGLGGGKRKGAKSKFRDFFDQRKKDKATKKAKKGSDKGRKKSVKAIYKYSKKDSIKAYMDQGMSRGEAKDQTMKDAIATRQKQSKEYRDSKARPTVVKQKSPGVKDSGKFQGTPAEQRAKSPGGTPTKKLKGSESVSFDKEKGLWKIVGGDGYVRYTKKKPAMYGAKVKAVKKAKNGGKVKKGKK